MFGDDHALDLRGALVDLGGSNVPEEPFDDRASPIALRRQNLHRLVGGAVRGLGGVAASPSTPRVSSRGPWRPASLAVARSAAFSVSMRAASSSVAMSASIHCIAW